MQSSSHGGLLVIVILVVIVAVVIGLFVRRREITFTGEVIDKDVAESQMNNTVPNNPGQVTINNGGVRHTYTIKVKTDAGKTIHYQVSEGKYELIKIGDRVSKAKGTTDVEIVSSAATNQPPASPVSPTPPAQPPAPTTPTPPTVPPSQPPIS